MSYTKPEVAKLADAVESIQGNGKVSTHPDNVSGMQPATVGAYEADE